MSCSKLDISAIKASLQAQIDSQLAQQAQMAQYEQLKALVAQAYNVVQGKPDQAVAGTRTDLCSVANVPVASKDANGKDVKTKTTDSCCITTSLTAATLPKLTLGYRRRKEDVPNIPSEATLLSDMIKVMTKFVDKPEMKTALTWDYGSSAAGLKVPAMRKRDLKALLKLLYTLCAALTVSIAADGDLPVGKRIWREANSVTSSSNGASSGPRCMFGRYKELLVMSAKLLGAVQIWTTTPPAEGAASTAATRPLVDADFGPTVDVGTLMAHLRVVERYEQLERIVADMDKIVSQGAAPAPPAVVQQPAAFNSGAVKAVTFDKACHGLLCAPPTSEYSRSGPVTMEKMLFWFKKHCNEMKGSRRVHALTSSGTDLGCFAQTNSDGTRRGGANVPKKLLKMLFVVCTLLACQVATHPSMFAGSLDSCGSTWRVNSWPFSKYLELLAHSKAMLAAMSCEVL